MKNFKLLILFVIITTVSMQAKTSESSGALSIPSTDSISVDRNIYKSYAIKDGVDLFTGHAAFSVPIYSVSEGGSQPISVDVNLSFHGGMLAEIRANNDAMQASEVGVGFSLSLMNIRAENYGTHDYSDDTYLLDFGNKNLTKLIQEDGDIFVTEEFSNWKIIRLVYGSDVIGWHLFDEHGIQYYLGDCEEELTSVSNTAGKRSTVVKFRWNNWVGDGYVNGQEYVATGWFLSKVVNDYGNEINVYYSQERERLEVELDNLGNKWKSGPLGLATPWAYTKAIYPQKIISQSGEEIRFELANRDRGEWEDKLGSSIEVVGYDDPPVVDEYQENYQTKYIDKIQYYKEGLFVTSTELVFETKTAGSDPDSDFRIKRWLEELIITDRFSNELPSYKFTYFDINGTTSSVVNTKGLLESITYPSGGSTTYGYSTYDDPEYETISETSLGYPLGGNDRVQVFQLDDENIYFNLWIGHRYKQEVHTIPEEWSFSTWKTIGVKVFNDIVYLYDNDHSTSNKRLIRYRITPAGCVEDWHTTLSGVYDIYPVSKDLVATLIVGTPSYINIYDVDNSEAGTPVQSSNISLNFSQYGYECEDDIYTFRVESKNNNQITFRDYNQLILLDKSSDSWVTHVFSGNPYYYNEILGEFSPRYMYPIYSKRMIGNKMFDGVQWNTVTDYHLGYVEDNNNYYANYLSPAMYELKQRRYFTAGWWQDVEIDDGDATTSDDGEFGEVMTQNGINIYDTEVKIDKIGSVIKASVEYYDGITINQGGPYEQNIDVLEHVNAFVFMESEMTGEGNKKHYEHLNELIYEIQGWYTENYYNDYMLFFNSNGDILRYVTNQNFGDIKTPEIKKFNGDSWAAGWTSFDDSPINQFDYSNSFGTTSCYGIMDAIYSPLKQSYNGGISSGDVLGIAESGLTSYKTVRLDPFTEVVNGELTVQLPTVSSKTTEDGHGNSILKEFLYEQGIYRAESKSLTFGKVIVSHNNGELIEQKLYYNDLSVAEGIEYPDLEDPTLVDGWVLDGKLYQSSSKKQPGLPADILSSEDTQYESYLHDVENSIYQIRPIGSQTTIDDVTTVTSITFNSEGLVSQKEISQDISDPGSSTKKTVKTKYAYEKYSYPQDQNKYSQVYSTIVIDGTSNVEAKTWNIWTGSETQYYTRTHEHIWVGNPLEEDDQNAPDDPGESILVQSYEYDDYGNVIQVTDANGNITKLYYGSDNDPFTNDNKRELTGVQYVVGNIDNLPWTGDDIFGQFEYDPLFNKVAKIVNSDGSETSYEYDDFGRLSGIKNNSGNIISEYSYTFSRGVSSDDYDPDNPNLINIIDHPALGENIATELFSDGLGRSIETIRVQTGPEKDIIGAVEYDQNGRKFKEWNPYEIDLSLNEYQSDYAIGAGYNVETHYDVLGRKTKVIPQNETTADIDFEYGSEVVDGILRRFTKVTDEVGDEVIEYYDIFNNKIRSIHGYGTAEQATTDFTYNVLGNMTSFTNPEGQTIEFLFDPRGQMLESDHPDLGITKYRYDNNGNLKFEQNQIRANDSVYGWKFHRYDNLNRLVSSGLSITDPQIEPVTYNENDIIKQSFYYDDPISENSMGKLAVSFDHESMIAKIYHYDTEGRVSREQSLYNAVVANTPMEISVVVSDKGPIIDTETFEIDHDQFMFFSLQYGLAPHCHTKVTVERSGVVVDEVTDSGGSLGVLAGDIVTIEARNDYKFDEKVKLSLSYTLNELDQISGQHKTMSYFYNNLGNVTAITYPDGNKVESTYDDFGRLSAVPGYLDGDNEIGFRYTPNDQLSELHYGNGISFTQQYDERLRLSQVNQSGTGTHLGFDQDFTYFGDNNIQQISLRNSSSSIFNQSNFVYDSRDQLTYSIYSAGVGNDQSYKYDKNGNRIERNTVAYNYLEDVQENRVNNMLLGLGVSTTDFTYDEVGNLEEDHIEGLKYEYDWCNRLVSVLSDNWYQWEVDINYPMTFENQNNALRLFGANNKNWKYAKKKTTPVKVASTSDEVTIKFDIMRNAHVDMDYILIAFEDSVAGSGTLVRYYGRSSNNLLVRQYHTEGGSKINTTVFTGAVPITGVSWTNIKLTLNDLDGTFRFELHNDDDDIDLTVALDDKISGLNSIKFNFIEADFSIDNIQISSADQYPYSYVDNFDGSFSTGLAGQIARYYYNTEGERLIKASPSGYIKYITDNNNRPYAETDAQGVVAESYIYGGSQRLVKLDRIGTTPIGTPFENNLEFITDMTNGHGASFSVNPDNREGDNSIQVNISYESSYSFGNFTIDGAPSYDAAVTSYIHVWVKPGANAEYLKFFVKDETASSPGNTYYDQFFGDIDGDGKFEVGEDLIANEWNELWLDANNLYHSGHTGSSSPPEISTFHAHANNPLTSGSPDVVFSFDHVYATISPYSTFFYHSDHLGSARRISDTDGGLEWMREYYPFGEIRGTYGAVENSKYHFTGQERDFETGLDYSWHRFRSTEHGAFSQVDAKWIEFASLSPYHYVFNNPISLIDQNGLNPESLMAPIGDGGHREYLPAEPNPIKLTQKQQAVVDVTADVTVAVVATTLAVGTLMTPVPSDNLATGKLLKYASIKMGSALVAAGGLVSLIDVDDNESKATDGISGSGSILQGAGNIASKSYFKGVYQILKGLFDTSKATSGLEELLNEEIELIDEEEIKNTTAPVEVLEQN